MGHFHERCRQRGIVKTDAEALRVSLGIAIRDKRFDLIDMVLRTDSAEYYRFRCEDGIFYCVTGLGESSPRTVLTQEMMRNKKRGHKYRKRFRTAQRIVTVRSSC
ncbi:hypothetical protein GCM10011360_17580 [Primorskyibacter flagellatus]|uniref:Uncharacterized protein n=1 Tax=Primorskyibacter flagellatus TaxID=1387277 RepID=A0A917EEH7_9RHOB|nr:hypothetical protein [Primorskyibacter flagellatus]GGE29987.1 hypothetical protein GCM10011360_17580 [Primorskyibacter flagellatus]